MHITWIKDFFKRTNMRKGYEKQILDHNVEKFSLMVRDDIDMFSSTETLTQADKIAVLQVNSVSGAKKITEELKWHIKSDERIRYVGMFSSSEHHPATYIYLRKVLLLAFDYAI